MRNVLLGVVLALASASGCGKSDDHKAPAADEAPVKWQTMSVDQVDAELAAKTITAVDCNGDMTRKKMGVVPGAILVTDEESYAPSELPADKTTKLVFYCSNPGWHASHVGAGRAKKLGYTNVYLMPDGIAGWVSAGKKVQQI